MTVKKKNPVLAIHLPPAEEGVFSLIY